MKSLPKPNFEAKLVFCLCADSVRKRDLSSRLYSVAEEIETAEAAYNDKGQSSTLFTIPEETTISGVVTKKEMEKLYTGTFSRQGSKLRPIYDKIKLAPRLGICPLCGQRIVSQLDHYLPKSAHPSYAVAPINLVPSCSDCNKAKLDSQGKYASEQTLHPYFDEVDDEIWLGARIEKSSPPAIVFFVTPPNSWSTIKRDRIKYHFKTLGLGPLYSSNAGAELINARYSIARIADRGGTGDLVAHLKEQAESRQEAEINSWQAAMYRALSNSKWFCEIGYQKIG